MKISYFRLVYLAKKSRKSFMIKVKIMMGGNLMETKNINISVSQELLPYLYTIRDGKSVSDKLMITSVVGLFTSQIVTLEKAAELLGKSVWEFMDILNDLQIPWGEYTKEEMKLDEIAINKLTGELYE